MDSPSFTPPSGSHVADQLAKILKEQMLLTTEARAAILQAIGMLRSAPSEKTPQGYPVPCAGGLWDERPYGGEGDSISVCSICNQPAGDHRDIVAVPSAIERTPHQLAPEETDKLLLGAWTGFEHSYPQFYNATMVRMKGHVILSVRLHGSEACSSVRFTREAWNEFAKEFEAMNRKYQAADNLDSIL